MCKKFLAVRGEEYTVDVDIFEKEVAPYRWMSDHYGYARRSVYNRVSKRSETVLLHRVIMNAKKGEIVDHINGDIRDNRRENLRIVSRGQNRWNSKMPFTNSSGYKGVSYDKESGKWLTQIRYNNKPVKLGRFQNKHDAARMYNFWARDLHGEYARINKIDEMEAK